MKKIVFAMVLSAVFEVVPQQDYSIDVVIPCHEKDMRTLELAIAGIRNHGKNVRRIIVVSSRKLTDSAEWFNEARYPFTKDEILSVIFNNDKAKMGSYVSNRKNRIGWIYQQLLKLYAPLVIPDISSQVLILDADTIFFRDVEFIDEEGCALYNVDINQYHAPYFDHGKRLLPSFKKVFSNYSGITNHMLFRRSVLELMFNEIQEIHQCDPWKALCKCISHKELFWSGLSEYELYFNYVFSLRGDNKVKVRLLKWQNMGFRPDEVAKCKGDGFHYVTCHVWG